MLTLEIATVWSDPDPLGDYEDKKRLDWSKWSKYITKNGLRNRDRIADGIQNQLTISREPSKRTSFAGETLINKLEHSSNVTGSDNMIHIAC